jgi:hypothetical protein
MAGKTAQRSGRRVLGFPVEGFSLIQSLLLTLASTLIAFFGATAAAIFALLAWNLTGHHAVNYAASYLYVGLPVAALAFVVTAPLFAALWLRARLHG